MAVAFDTLTYARRLREVGVPQEQAEAYAEAVAAAVTETLATKQDLAALRQELRELASATKQAMRELELRLTIRLGGMMGVSVAVVAALARLL